MRVAYIETTVKPPVEKNPGIDPSSSLRQGQVFFALFNEGLADDDPPVQPKNIVGGAAGTRDGCAWVLDPPNAPVGMDFTGSCKIAWANAGSLSAGFSISTIVNIETSPTSYGTVLSVNNAANTAYAMVLLVRNTRRIYCGFAGGPNRETNLTLNYGESAHILATFDGSGLGTGIHIYVNGVEGTYYSTNNGAPPATPGSWSLGNLSYNLTWKLDGVIKTIGVWNRPLLNEERDLEHAQPYAGLLVDGGNAPIMQQRIINGAPFGGFIR